MLELELQKKFIILYSFERKKYADIEAELDIERSKTRELYDVCKAETEKIQKIRNKFTGQRRNDFNESFEDFYKWYIKEVDGGAKCSYCGISQEELYEIFREEEALPLNDAVKRSSGTLEIERKDSASNSYGADNIILACPLCNNAKSNLIDESSWRKLFVPPMRVYYEKLLGKELVNSLPKEESD
jgi:hypothetical protein